MFMLGTLPGMVRVDWPLDLSSSSDRAVSFTETLDGGSYGQISPHTAREWSLSASHLRVQDVAAVEHVINSAGVSPLVLVTERAFTTNGLTPGQAALKTPHLPTGVSRGGMEWVQDEWGEWQAAWTAGTTLTGEWVLGGPPCPVIPGGPVTVAAGLRRNMIQQSARLGVEWVSASGTTLGRDMGDVTASPAQPLPRVHRTLTAPVNAVAARMVIHRATQVAAPSLTLTARLRPWDVGDGAPSVAVSGGRDSSPARTAERHLYVSYSLSLREVGLAHW